MDLEDKLLVSWRRIKEDRKTDFIICDFEYQVFDRFKADLIGRLCEKIQAEEHEYQPEPLRIIRVPKGLHTTRPGSIPEICDRIYYQYLVDEIADQVEINLLPVEDKVLHSYRYKDERTNPEMFKFDSASYSTFMERTREISKLHEFVVITDVSSYFERIYRHEIDTVLKGLGADGKTVSALSKLLNKWATGSSYGIPQGVWASDYIGNVYLDPIDKFVVRSGYNYCRYMDDIRIGVDSIKEGKMIIVKIEEQLSGLGLSLNDQKTKIIPSSNLESEINPHSDRFNEIIEELGEEFPFDPYWEPSEDELEEMDEVIKIESMQQLFREEIEKEHPHSFICRFCLKKFKAFHDEDVIDNVLNNINKLIVVTPNIVNYLVAISKNTSVSSNIVKKVSSIIDEPYYDWQQMWYLYCLNRIENIDKESIEHIRRLIMMRTDLHEAVIVQALLLIGEHGDSGDRAWIESLYKSNTSRRIKNAIIYALKKLPTDKRNHLYCYWEKEDYFSEKLISYIKEVT
jgi:hypothetical protein